MKDWAYWYGVAIRMGAGIYCATQFANWMMGSCAC